MVMTMPVMMAVMLTMSMVLVAWASDSERLRRCRHSFATATVEQVVAQCGFPLESEGLCLALALPHAVGDVDDGSVPLLAH